MSRLRVERTGPRTTMQDDGRPGLAHLGVPRAGAADRSALHRANQLVGNPPDAAALETTLGGLVLTALGDVTVACVGSPLTVDAVNHDGVVAVREGATITVGAPRRGVYSYLAVAGGIDVPPSLCSRSTDTLADLGPPAMCTGDILPIGTDAPNTALAVPNEHRTPDEPLRVMAGPRADWFIDNALQVLIDSEWTVLPDSDRTGLRLSGPKLARHITRELPSEGMVPGAIQVPPDGQPIVLLNNHPTTGGYPVIAVVLAVDVDRATQHRPGAQLRFRYVD